ncbi:iron chelate uptake ABC transporter family permease subunit [Streptomyces sp. RFCAC02]|uniref:FecCD family ABC transporter permease n=1 Tax=Streptomyces sp. RFCAC02 TaxID=2499143 RepID=UPI0019CF9C85|nr:iron chelate uptake ABC transporter family permease subunit [Streptomyces sp. RFCAC02]
MSAATGSPPRAGRRPAESEALAAARLAVRASRDVGRRRGAVVCAVLAVLLVAVFTGTVCLSGRAVPLGEVVEAIGGGGTRSTYYLIVELRLPRALTGLLVGAAFGLAGALFQTLLRNPLASPDVIGISAGASAAAVVATVAFGVSGAAMSLSALGGALLAAALIYALAWRRGVSGQRLVLVGVGVAAALMSVVSHLMTRSSAVAAQEAKVWLTGSLNGRGWEHVGPLLVALAVLLPLTAAATRSLGALQLGDDTASGLGARVERSRLALIGCAVALTGVATAAAGPVGFVAFVSGPVARRMVRGTGTALVPAALVGALLVLVADLVGQHALGPNQFPVGMVTSMVGAPYLLWLLARTNRVGRGG